MSGEQDNDEAVVSHGESEPPSRRGGGLLVKEPGADLETHGAHFAHLDFEIDLDRYVGEFNEQVIGAYGQGEGAVLPADTGIARSLIPPGTGVFRDFSHVAPALPRFIAEQCVACMECVIVCPDTAILGRVADADVLESTSREIEQADERADFEAQWAKTTKFFEVWEKKGESGGMFSIHVDPTKCKGCGECVVACGSHAALEMVEKSDGLIEIYRKRHRWIQDLPESPERFLARKLPVDLMLNEERCLLYVGGGGSCAGCGEATAIRMMLAATGELYAREEIGIIAATGCNTVYGSTYPYNPYLVTWSSSLFENAPAVAMGVRARWNQQGWQRKRLWVLGGDGAMYDIGFQSLSRMLCSGMDIKVLVLDTQAYSNTGGQTSMASYTAQEAKMSPYGRMQPGKLEGRKELANIALMHPEVYVAQTVTAYVNHFHRAIREANEYPGPALVNVFTTCQPEHGVADDMAIEQSRRAVHGRAFPLFIYDPRKGERMRERLSLRGNPAMTEDWPKEGKTGQPFTFVDFARTEGRFRRQFSADDEPSEALLKAQADRLRNWHLLQELAGLHK
ncbi:MAG: thiamine pyrophosphate-dependent enzyme [Myxococcales bacterium]|nr:thiamine pyrophosphate-dependent enzyme [Myxococcales bacterium]MDH5565430.1 thiamine pyrophosphate-dependent enzyme [Myxococcales bacterium]